jgi:hypothetical protein
METCACLTMNDVGDPCAGEPHARFDRGPLATLTAYGATEHTHPSGKPAGLSPPAYPRPAEPAPTERALC